MQPEFDLLTAGEINPDLILSGDVQPAFGQVEKLVNSAGLTIGSSSVIFACGAARLGLKVAFCGVCGADVFGRFMLEEMTAHGVDVSAVRVDPGPPDRFQCHPQPRRTRRSRHPDPCRLHR